MNHFRVGFGYDAHQLVPGRKLMVGGIFIPHTKGALGHSDADVLLHAIADALLGAAALGDIGMHFPDTDARYKNIDSKIIVRHVADMLKEKNYSIGNIDTTVVLQQPRLSTYIPEMKKQIACILKINESRVSVKATTTEQMGFVGREEGIAAYAVVMVERDKGVGE
jgi:2-C-methyl-D-erythritol 2,4-cyclodiphosphate synthase